MQILQFLAPLLAALSLGWFARRFVQPSTEPSLIAQFIGMSNEVWLRLLSVVLIMVCLGSTLLNILVVFYFHIIDPVVISLVSGFNGAVLGILAMVPGYWLGSSNGSRLKDAKPEAAA